MDLLQNHAEAAAIAKWKDKESNALAKTQKQWFSQRAAELLRNASLAELPELLGDAATKLGTNVLAFIERHTPGRVPSG